MESGDIIKLLISVVAFLFGSLATVAKLLLKEKDRQVEDCAKDVILIRAERDHYRDLVFSTLPLLDKAISTVERGARP